MAQENQGTVISCKANDASITAYKVVAVSGVNTVDLWDTETSAILGVSTMDAAYTGSAIGIIISGTARVTCFASVAAGAVVGVNTGTGKCVALTTHVLNTTTTAIPRQLGVAMQNGSTNAVIEVALHINNIRVAFA